MSDPSGPIKFGKYTVLARIGAGGMAEVFKCRQAGIGGFDKIVVIKRILPDLAQDPEIVTMFLDEARLAANLNHPNIIQIYEIDEFGGLPYIAMEYVQGPTFRSMLGMQKRADLPFEMGVAAKVMSGICSALYYVHNTCDVQGRPLQMIHRDVSPPNILVSTDGVPKLLDFGVAKALSQASTTRAGAVKGKLKFMPPEQMQPDVQIDHRLDIFSAGVCLYQATTGRLPYNGVDDVAIIIAAAKGEFLPPSALVPGYPPELEQIVLWAMEPDRNKRCPNADLLHQALEKFVATAPYETSTRTVKQHIATLFPRLEEDSRAMINAYSSGKHTGSLSSFQPSEAIEARRNSRPLPVVEESIAPTRRRGVIAVAAFIALAAIATAIWLLARSPKEPIADPSAEARSHLALAEELIAAHKPEMAREALGLARKSNMDGALQVRARALDAQLAALAPVVPTLKPVPVEVYVPTSQGPPDKPKVVNNRPSKKPVAAKSPVPAPPEVARPAPAPVPVTVAPVKVEPARPPPVAVAAAAPASPAADDFGCKDDAVAKGAGPPRGTSRWCEAPDGTKQGRSVRWYANGVKAEEGEYKNGKKNGRWIEYFESGLERERTNWRRGVTAF